MPNPCNPDISDLKWKVISKKLLLEDNWLKVQSHQCETPNGAIIAPYYVLMYPDWVNIVAITRCEHKLILVQEYRHGVQQVMPGLVSGAVKTNSTGDCIESYEEAARREMLEETGYGGGTFEQILTSFPNSATHNNRVITFLATDVEVIGEQNFDPEGSEHVEFELTSLSKVIKSILDGEVKMQAMHVAALLTAMCKMKGSVSCPSS